MRVPYRLLLLGALTTALSGCQIFENLTEPATGALQRTVTLSMSPTSLPEGGGDIEVEATVLVAEAPEVGILVSFSATAGEFPDGDTAETDDNGTARVRLRTSVTTEVIAAIKAAGIVLTESSAGRLEVGDEVVPTGNVKFDVKFTPRPAALNQPVRIEITATNEDGSAAAGALKVEFGDGKSTRIPDFRRRATVQHTYREASFFNVVTSLSTGGGEVSSKTVSLRVNDTTETAIELSAATVETYAREPLNFSVALTRARLAQASGSVTIDWGDGRSNNLGEVNGSTSIEHTFRDPGSYRVVASVTTANGKGGRADVRIRVEPRLTAEIDLAADVGPVGESTHFTVAARLSNGATPSGMATLSYGDGSSDTGRVTSGTAEADHTYANEGTFTARIDFEDDAGRSASAAIKVVITAEGTGGGGGGEGWWWRQLAGRARPVAGRVPEPQHQRLGDHLQPQ